MPARRDSHIRSGAWRPPLRTGLLNAGPSDLSLVERKKVLTRNLTGVECWRVELKRHEDGASYKGEVEKRRELQGSRRIILSGMMDRQECLSYFGPQLLPTKKLLTGEVSGVECGRVELTA